MLLQKFCCCHAVAAYKEFQLHNVDVSRELQVSYCCQGVAIAILLSKSCSCHVVSVASLLLWMFHAVGMLWPCCYHAIAVDASVILLLLCYSQAVAEQLLLMFACCCCCHGNAIAGGVVLLFLT